MMMIFLDSSFWPDYLDLGFCFELKDWSPLCDPVETSTAALHAQSSLSLKGVATLVAGACPAP
jgi:hypothetical protein